MKRSIDTTATKTKIAVADLRLLIREYESDTFSADAAGLKENELDQLVAELIKQIEDDLDGVTLSATLTEIREGRIE